MCRIFVLLTVLLVSLRAGAAPSGLRVDLSDVPCRDQQAMAREIETRMAKEFPELSGNLRVSPLPPHSLHFLLGLADASEQTGDGWTSPFEPGDCRYLATHVVLMLESRLDRNWRSALSRLPKGGVEIVTTPGVPGRSSEPSMDWVMSVPSPPKA